MPQPPNEFPDYSNFNSLQDLKRTIKSEVPTQISQADANASKEIGRLAIYLRDNFPKEAATKEKTVDVVIDLLNELKSHRNNNLAKKANY